MPQVFTSISRSCASALMALSAMVLLGSPAAAGPRAAEIDALFEALNMPEMFTILQEEGEAYGDDLAEEMLPGGTGPGWQAVVRRLHDPASLEEIMRAAFEESFGNAEIAPLLSFFQSESGQRIIELELAARRAFMEEGTEEAARDQFRGVQEPYEAHLAAIEAFIVENELVEMNVVGALNANIMFMRGLIQGGAIEMSEEDVLSDVWAQEPTTRMDTHEWVYSFLMLAYEPLSTEEVQAYVALSRTPEGQALNRALFAGFDRMYGTVSMSLGLALARQMEGESL
ncbi:hypothetical protein TL5118_01624 [Thalassovita autumnalis]|uniref:DUF2059 domain-containing protein n=1 Tax=Thalassovita autumnalis TaxID=2072972 RepID=A0A0N7LXP2_9RHOB|nr:DUF2059 domain-containing protein [Thalassovita autumnalis]CUH66135.1 hypothetical protein TL5118_01624 [Thalassovita autumnalis]CUH72455.1 hypothetical protein TL5120_02256 [Thalassovita autumnalis]